MSRRIDVTKIHLSVTNVGLCKDAIIVSWESDIGFGEYTIYIEAGKIKGYSECMDRNEDREFLREVLAKTSEYIVDNINIVG